MHIPGHGFLSIQVSAAASVFSVWGTGIAIRWLRRRLDRDLVLRMAAVAALLFAAQMFNYPVSGGTSGHLIGAMLAAVILGPYAASLVMASVLVVQCALFGDGGHFSLGANILNMAVVAVWVGWAFFSRLSRGGTTSGCIALFAGSWASVIAASSACSLEIALAGTSPLGEVLPAMIGVHSAIGVGEGLITVSAYAAFARIAPSLTFAPSHEWRV